MGPSSPNDNGDHMNYTMYDFFPNQGHQNHHPNSMEPTGITNSTQDNQEILSGTWSSQYNHSIFTQPRDKEKKMLDQKYYKTREVYNKSPIVYGDVENKLKKYNNFQNKYKNVRSKYNQMYKNPEGQAKDNVNIKEQYPTENINFPVI